MPPMPRRSTVNPPVALADAAPRVRDTCVCLHLQRAARTVGRRYDAALQPTGLTHEQFSLLMLLVRPEPPTVGALAAELALDRTTLSSNLRPLVRRSLLRLAVDAADARVRRPVLTPEGHALLQEALPLWRAVQLAVADAHPDLDWLPLRQGLRTLAT